MTGFLLYYPVVGRALDVMSALIRNQGFSCSITAVPRDIHSLNSSNAELWLLFLSWVCIIAHTIWLVDEKVRSFANIIDPSVERCQRVGNENKKE